MHTEVGSFQANLTPFATTYGFDPLTGYTDTRAKEQVILECMREHGFEYVAYDPQLSTDEMAAATALSLHLPNSTGYGILASLSRDRHEQIALPEDQNNAYLETLSPTERDAYIRAMFGNVGDSNSDQSDFGCVGRGNDSVPAQTAQNAAWLEEAASEVESRTFSDADVIAATDEWSDCMNERGFSYASRPELFEQLLREFRPVFDAVAAVGRIESADASLSATIESFREKEVTLATADIECDRSVGWTATYLEAITRYQQEFIEQHPVVGS